jgi:hypothetical protein
MDTFLSTLAAVWLVFGVVAIGTIIPTKEYKEVRHGWFGKVALWLLCVIHGPYIVGLTLTRRDKFEELQ